MQYSKDNSVPTPQILKLLKKITISSGIRSVCCCPYGRKELNIRNTRATQAVYQSMDDHYQLRESQLTTIITSLSITIKELIDATKKGLPRSQLLKELTNLDRSKDCPEPYCNYS